MAKDADEQSRSSPVVVLELPPPPPPPLKKPSSPAAGWMPLPADEASTLSLGLAKAGHAAVRQSPTTATRNLVIMAAGRRQVSALCDDETLCAPSPWPFLIAQKKQKKRKKKTKKNQFEFCLGNEHAQQKEGGGQGRPGRRCFSSLHSLYIRCTVYLKSFKALAQPSLRNSRNGTCL